MRREQLEMLKTLQAYEFTAYDFVLYLDTHPSDQRALADFNRANNEAEQLRKGYEANYGPLMQESGGDSCQWRWIEEPWPWEIEY